MAITFDNAIYQQSSNQNHSMTITLAANSVLFAFMDAANGAAIVSAMDCGGVAMTSISGAATFSLYGFVCSAPPTGVTTFRVGLTGAFQHAIGLVSYTGAPTNNQMGNPKAQTSGSASNYNISVSSTTTDLVVTCLRVAGATNAAFVNNGTSRLSGTNSGLSRLIIADLGGASSITLSATVQTAAASWESLSVPLHFGATTTGLIIKMLLGVGV